MILTLDVGNSNITIGCIGFENKIYFVSRLFSDLNKTEDEYRIDFENILNLYNIDVSKIEGGIISSVVPPLISAHKNAIKKIIKKDPIIVENNLKLNFKIDLDKNVKLGSDLIVGASAAIEEYKLPIIIFDLGTATTVSVINKKKIFIGGLILPGIKISLDSLSNKTSQLPHIEIRSPKNIIGKNTLESMRSGIVNGTSSLIDGLINKIEEELEEKCSVILTGGFSKMISEHCKENIIYDENLLLKGLVKIYKINKIKKRKKRVDKEKKA